jgi:hypothetical protein
MNTEIILKKIWSPLRGSPVPIVEEAGLFDADHEISDPYLSVC